MADEMIYTPEMNAILEDSGSVTDKEKSLASTRMLAKALETPLRQGVLFGDIIGNWFTPIDIKIGATIDFPLDFLAPGTEKNFVAYTIPNHGRIPERHIEGDVIAVSTYEIAASIDWLLKYARDARWDVVNRATTVLEASFTKKLNDDAFHTVLAAAVDRNIVVYDSLATSGVLTKRLISLMQQVMRRNQGGNSTSVNRGKLTDLYMSPEALEDIRNWSIADIDEVTRREIFTATDGVLNKIFGITLHDLDELGVGQQYQNFYLNDLGGQLGPGDQELVLGVDNGTNDCFLMPVREKLQIWEDDMHRQRRAGLYGWQEQGFVCLDGRRLLLGSL